MNLSSPGIIGCRSNECRTFNVMPVKLGRPYEGTHLPGWPGPPKVNVASIGILFDEYARRQAQGNIPQDLAKKHGGLFFRLLMRRSERYYLEYDVVSSIIKSPRKDLYR